MYRSKWYWNRNLQWLKSNMWWWVVMYVEYSTSIIISVACDAFCYGNLLLKMCNWHWLYTDFIHSHAGAKVLQSNNVPHMQQLLSVALYPIFPMDSSPTLPTPHLTMIWELWPLMPVPLGLFWTSPWGDLRWELVWMIWTMMQREYLIVRLQYAFVSNCRF